MKKLIFFMGALLLFTACEKNNQGNDRLVQKAGLEAEEANKKAIEAENKRATEMEEDLNIRQRFFTAMKGAYEGELRTEEGMSKIRVKIIPSIPPYNTDRIRRIDEVKFDIINLHFKIQVSRWFPGEPLSSSGCSFVEIRPDIENGLIESASEACPNVYTFSITNDEDKSANINKRFKDAIAGKSAELANRIINGESNSVDEIVGETTSIRNATSYKFVLRKVEL